MIRFRIIYYEPAQVSERDLALMRRLDELHLQDPNAGSRMLKDLLAAKGSKAGRRHVRTLMERMGIEAVYCRPRTSVLAVAKLERIAALVSTVALTILARTKAFVSARRLQQEPDDLRLVDYAQ